MFQLQHSHHQTVYIRSIKGKYVTVVYIQIQMTVKKIPALHVKVYVIVAHGEVFTTSKVTYLLTYLLT